MSRLAAVRTPLAAALALAVGLTAACSDAPTAIPTPAYAAPAAAKGGAPSAPALTGRIVFASTRASNGSFNEKIFTARPDGSDVQQLTMHDDVPGNAEYLRDQLPTWSPDGQAVAFVRRIEYADPTPTVHTVQIFYTNGQKGATYLKEEGLQQIYGVAWAPDGTTLAVAAAKPGEPVRIFLVSSNSAAPVYLTDGTQSASDPRFSPDGQKIAFIRSGGGTNAIMTMNRDGSGVTEVIRASGGIQYFRGLDWSPDGRRLLVAGAVGDKDTEIFTVLTNGSKLTRLTTIPGFDTEPTYSPDGKSIAFHHSGYIDQQLPPAGIYLMNADGTNLRLGIQPVGGSDVTPEWSPR